MNKIKGLYRSVHWICTAISPHWWRDITLDPKIRDIRVRLTEDRNVLKNILHFHIIIGRWSLISEGTFGFRDFKEFCFYLNFSCFFFLKKNLSMIYIFLKLIFKCKIFFQYILKILILRKIGTVPHKSKTKIDYCIEWQTNNIK